MRICVYGASSNAIDNAYIQVSEALGKALADRGHSLVYGAGAQGVMGAVARGVYARGGSILGVMPSFFNTDGIVFPHCTRLIRTETMRERKQIMEDNADAFIVAPGGIGTFEEFFEILTLKQLKRHSKPIALLNIRGYYDSMENMLQQVVDQHFMTEDCYQLYKFFDSIDGMLDYLEQYQPQDVSETVFKDV